MEVKKLQESEYREWDEFIIQSPQYSLFAHSWYIQALGIRFDIYVVKEKASIKAGILLTKDKWGYYINPVLCKYLGVYFFPFEGNAYTIESRIRKSQEALVEKIVELPSFEYTFHPSFENWMLFQRAGYKQTTVYTYLMDLKNTNSEDILNRMSSRLRNKILNAAKLKYTCSSLNRFSTAFPILKMTYEIKNRKLPINEEVLLNLISILEKKKAFHCMGAYNQTGELCAVLGLFFDDRKAYLILNGLDNEKEAKGINEWLILEGIRWAKEKGLEQFDFEGSMIPSIESFYRQFGGELKPYYKIWKDSKQRSLRNLKQKIL